VSTESQEGPLLYKSNYIPQGQFTYQNFQAEESTNYLNEKPTQQIPPQQYPQNIKLSNVLPPQNYANFQNQFPINQQFNPQNVMAPVQNQQRIVEYPPRGTDQQQPIIFEQQRPQEQLNVVQQPRFFESQSGPLQPNVIQQQRVLEQDQHIDQQTRIIDQQPRFVDQQPRLVDQQQRFIDQEPRFIEQQPRFIEQQQPRIIEQQPQGFFVDPQGRFIENGRVLEGQQNIEGFMSSKPMNLSLIHQQGMPPQGFYSNTVFNPNQQTFVQTTRVNQFGVPQNVMNFENYAQPQIRLVDENFGKPQQQGEGWSNGNDLDKRIQDALKASEETLKRNQEYLLRTNGKNFFLNLFVL
jgi:hypothetical protein